MPNWYSFQLLLDPEDKRTLNRCAEVERCSLSDVLRRALRSHAMVLAEQVANRKPPSEVLRSATTAERVGDADATGG
jgi:hypothetical protein